MNAYDLTPTKAFALLERVEPEKANEYMNHTQLGYDAGGAFPGAADLLAVLGYQPDKADPTAMYVAGWGDVVDLRITATLTQAAAVAAATGATTQHRLGTITAPEWQPRQYVAGQSVGGGRGVGVFITPSGEVFLRWALGAGDITQGTSLDFAVNYVRKGLA